VDIGYSVKTNPSPILLTLAANNGMLAETINALEVDHAISRGFSSDDIVVNGPAQFWPDEVLARGPFRAVFADSLERLAHLMRKTGFAQFVGVRLKPPEVLSRFGVDLHEAETYSSLIKLLRESEASQDLGIHFHISADFIGAPRWWEIYESMLHWAQAIETNSGKVIRCIDVGGGWFPEDFIEEFGIHFPEVIKQAKEVLPGIQALLLEPGKALAQPCMALLTQVLEVRHSQRASEAVVDTATSDLPMALAFPHRLLAFGRSGSSSPIPSGDDRIVGRNCMESDIISERIAIPSWLAAGDLVAICDAGAYDASMAYDFGRGRIHDV
jgi:diaminopimelate decarboxylase